MRNAINHTNRFDQFFKRGRVVRFDFQQHRMLARYMMTFEYIVELLDGLLELTDSARIANRHSNKSSYILTQQPCIDRRVVAGDQPTVFKFLDSLYRGRRRQADILSQLDQRNAA